MKCSKCDANFEWPLDVVFNPPNYFSVRCPNCRWTMELKMTIDLDEIVFSLKDFDPNETIHP